MNMGRFNGLLSYMSLLIKFYDVCDDAEIAEELEATLFNVCDVIEDELGMWEDLK